MDAVEKVKEGGVADVIGPMNCARRALAFKTVLSLKALATKAIVNLEWSNGAGERGNPLDALPKVLKLDMFKMFVQKNHEEKDVLQPGQWRLAEMLLQSTDLVSQVDFTTWRSSQNVHKLENLVIQHCPQLKCIIKEWFYTQTEGTLPPEPFNRLVLSLRNLSKLLLKDIYIDAEILAYLSINSGHLEELQFSLKFTDLYEVAGSTRTLQRFVNLKTLCIFIKTAQMMNLEKKAMVWMVGLVLMLPKLEALDCSPMDFEIFTAEWDRRSGGRPLLILSPAKFHEETDFEVWPHSLGLKSLELEGPLDEEVVQHFCTIRSERIEELSLYDIKYSSCLKILQSLASNVTKLDLILCPEENLFQFEPILLSQLLLAAPKVSNFHLFVDPAIYGLMAPLQPQLTDSHFEFWKSFEARSYYDDADEMVIVDARQGSGALSKMFELYLLGAKEVDSLEIEFPGLAHTALVTLQTNPKIGERIRNLSMVLPLYHRDELLTVTVDLAILVVLRSPLLEEVQICGFGVPDIPQDTFQGLQELTKAVGVKLTISC